MMLFQPSLLSQTYIFLFDAYISAGFPSPADDYTEQALDLNELLVKNPPSTFFARISDPNLENLGLYPNDIVVIDRSLKPSHGKLLLVVIDGELKIKKFAKKSQKYCEEFSNLTILSENTFELWGVITYVIHPV